MHRINCLVNHLTKWCLSKIEYNSHSLLQTDSREVGFILTDLDVRESHSQKLLVPPEHNLSTFKVDHCANYIACRPLLTVIFASSIPFFVPVTIEII